ncbi:MAG: MarR family transcriptional regulator [Myxococcaceae bacterium]|jgi:DNA-binding MarR family transcriptional regulator|nr:MarR family transcriptional regulator [Myxococcaceae bacterium]
MNPLALDAQLCFSLYAASRAVTAAYGPLLAPLGLTYPQYLVMLVLWEADDVSVREIGERLQLDSGTLTPLLTKLELRGLVARERDGEDARVVRIELTAAGRALRKKALSVPEALVCRMGASLPAIAKLRDELVGLTRTVRAANEAEPPVRLRSRGPVSGG